MQISTGFHFQYVAGFVKKGVISHKSQILVLKCL